MIKCSHKENEMTEYRVGIRELKMHLCAHLEKAQKDMPSSSLRAANR